jgi:hypothetical protein
MSTISDPPVRGGDGEAVYTPHEHEELRRLVARSRERASAVVTASVQTPKPA